MNTVQRSSFKFNPIAAAIALALTSPFAVNVAQAGSGFGDGVDLNSAPVKVPTFYANSPVGPVPALTAAGATTINAVTGLPVTAGTGKALRKFVDTLPGIPGVTPATVGGKAFGTNNLGQYIPLAVPEKWVDLNGVTTADDYYEIAAVEFSEKMHSDLPKATRLRGYVQLSTAKNPGKHIALKYPDGTAVQNNGVQVYAHDTPHHLGPIINSNQGTAVRVKFTNYLPVGLGGNLFVPVDTTITGAGTGPDGLTNYTQNRAEIHLVGGQAPWISAGTPHQWVAPAGEATAYAAGLGKGVSAQNVPDMADPGVGSTTLYFPNDMSARFMFYQDRTSGLTRLNSYAGLEAGYLVTDPIEQALVKAGTIPADQIPLIIEDKTFVPDNITQQDADWTDANWGKPGDLWFPHVYEINQDPNSINGANPVGRWDFGPLFWPIFPAADPLPAVSFTPEAFFDTPVINGTAYPTLTVDPKAYRFRILNASNDRYINLGFFKADTTLKAPQLDLNGNPIVDANGVQQFFTNTEVKMVPAVGDVAGNPVGWGAIDPLTGKPAVDSTGQPVQSPLPQYPTLKTNINAEPSGPSRAWPVDGRPGGAPDPATSGPDFIVIGNDGGLLPNPVDIPSQPVTYESNRRSITIGNIYGYGMLLGPAERTDAIVDFSQYAGQTLILYNDAPAPNPFNDVRNDYYTGGPDLTGQGGAYSTQPGYGPNTRTMMQVVVRATTPAAAFNADALNTALPAAYGASQPAPIVPAVAYNQAFGTNDTDIYAHVATGSIAQPTLDFSTAANGGIVLSGLDLISSGGTALAGGQIVGNAIPGSGTGYDPKNPPIVVFNNVVNGVSCLPLDAIGNLINGAKSAFATAVVDPGTLQVTGFANWNAGVGYTCAPTVTFQNPPGTNGVGGQVVVKSSNFHSYPVLAKAEQELFDNRGRYNSTGGVEIPLVSGVVQTTIPLNYIDGATETIKDGEVQIWKLVDNGLWTNSIHFNFVDVQLINRVGWDGTVKAPATNEVGWKDTLRLNPLEDVIIAVRAKNSNVPFGMPKSVRALDPSKPTGGAGSGMGFTNAVGLTPALPQTNIVADFDNEFVWNSALLSHSENDLARPVVFSPTVVVPDAPSNLVDTLGNGTLTWTDPTPAAQLAVPAVPANLAAVPPIVGSPAIAATLANPKNEIGFKIKTVTFDAQNNPSYSPLLDAAGNEVTVPANVTHWTQPTPINPNLVFAVTAYNAAGESTPSNGFTEQIPVAPANITANPIAYNSVTLNWTPASSSNQLQVWRGVGAATPVLIATLPGTAAGFVDNAANAALYKYTPVVSALTSYTYLVEAVNVTQPVASGAAISSSLTLTTPMIPVASPTIVSATPNAAGTSVVLRWTDNANNETAYWVDVSVKNSATSAVTNNPQIVIPRSAAQGTATAGTMTLTPNTVTVPGNIYTFTVTAVNVGAVVSTSKPASIVVDLSAPVAPAAPVVTAGVQTATRAPLSWLAVPGATSYLVQVSTNDGPIVSLPQTTSLAANPAIAAGNSYQFQVLALAAKYGLTTQSLLPSNVITVATPPAASTTPVAAAGPVGSKQITVSWTNTSSNITGFAVQRRFGGVWTTISPVVTPALPNAGLTTYTFTDTVVAAGSYSYRLSATSLGGTTALTATSNAVTAP